MATDLLFCVSLALRQLLLGQPPDSEKPRIWTKFAKIKFSLSVGAWGGGWDGGVGLWRVE